MTVTAGRPAADPFGAIAGEYEAWYATPLGAFVITEEERALLAALPEPPARVVEIGAGTGWWARALAARGYAVTAVEPSDAMRALGESRAVAGLAWVAAAGEDVPLADGAADAVLVTTVLEFAADPAAVLAEAWRVLRPGGTLVVGHLDALSSWTALYRHLADGGMAPWASARFVASDTVAEWVGRPPEAATACVFLAPGAKAPFDAADRAGVAAGNAGALAVLSWRKLA